MSRSFFIYPRVCWGLVFFQLKENFFCYLLILSSFKLSVPVSTTVREEILSLSSKCPQFSSVAQSRLTLWDPMDCSTPGFPVHHQLPELVQTHAHQVGYAIQPFHPLSSPSPPVFNLSQHQGLFKRVTSSHQVAKVWELQFQHQSFQWIFRTDFL